MITTCPHCGCDIDEHPRSIPQHRRFFKVISVAYQNWPNNHPFQPEDIEHLRAMLLVQAGWKHTHEVRFRRRRRRNLLRPERPRSSQSIELAAATLTAMMRGWKRHVFVDVDMRSMTLRGSTPRSIAYLSKREMDHFEACRVFSKVYDIICATIGVESTDHLLRAASQAA